MKYKYLGRVGSPDALKGLTLAEKELLCGEIRHKIIETVSKNGGHLASNLGVVELTVAIHSVFDSPRDSIIFDVGHQCYAHKLLTGRFDDFDTLRQQGGISGFMKPSESEHDPAITGHSSTSISVALGIAKANLLSDKNAKSIAVIGDGAMTGGIAYEALNNSGGSKDNLLIILNDNKMSIGRNVGGFSRHLTRIRTRPSYYRFKRKTEYHISRIPGVGRWLYRKLRNVKRLIKNAVYHSNMFEELGIHYYGPVDGHDLGQLIRVMQIARDEKRPVLIHAITTKGKGYSFAEKSPADYHGVSSIDPETGEAEVSGSSFSRMFGRLLCEAAEKDEKICAVTAAMCTGTGLTGFAERYPGRFFDVGIAEQHAVAFCAGLSRGGMLPVFAVYSSFLQRGYDQIIHDAAIGGLHIVLAVDRAGLVGEDGETHHGIMDIPFLTTIPGVKIYSPASYEELSYDLNRALYEDTGVAVVRYPRGGEAEIPAPAVEEKGYNLYGNVSSDRIMVTYGRQLWQCIKAENELSNEGADWSVMELREVYPISENIIDRLMDKKEIWFYEEGEKSGGIGEHLAAVLAGRGYSGIYRHIAVPDEFAPGASTDILLKNYGLDSESIVNRLSND